MKKVSEQDLITMILDLKRVIAMVQLCIPKSNMYDKTFAICNQVKESSGKLLQNYKKGLLLDQQQIKLDALILQERIDQLNVISHPDHNFPKPRYCPFCNKPIIGKITKVYCNENHRRKYLQNKQS